MLWAISVHLDKYLVERFFKDSNVAIMVLFTALVVVLALPIIWYFEPTVLDPSLGSIALIVLAGILYMTGMLFYLRALQNEEASVVAPFFQTGPLFGYVLAYLVLGETLSPRQLLGGVLIIVGALFVSIRIGQSMKMFKTRLAVLMVACGFIMALASLIFKVFAIKVEFWTTTFWMFVGEGIFGAALLMIPSYRRQFIALLRTNTAALLVDQRLERADQSRRRLGQSLCAFVRAVEHRASDRLDDDVVCLRIRHRAKRFLSRFWPREFVRPRIGAKGHGGDHCRDRRRAGDALRQSRAGRGR